jgi:molybdopterin/thiamine biosynthesis adenylyltransferase
MVIMLNATFNNISVISWRSVLLVEETRVPLTCHKVTDKFYHIILYLVYLAMNRFELTTSVVIGTDCNGSCKSNYHTITAMTASTETKTRSYRENCNTQHIYFSVTCIPYIQQPDANFEC